VCIDYSYEFLLFTKEWNYLRIRCILEDGGLMNKKVLSILFVFAYFAASFLNLVFASESIYQGHAETTDSIKEQSEYFTGKVDKLGRNDVLKMTVSKILDVNFSKEGDEFFAEVTNDVEGNSGVIIPSGTIAHGQIKSLESAKRLGRDGSLELDFDYLITPDGREIPIKGKMSTKLNPVVATSKIIATDIGYTAVGGTVGGVLGLTWLGLRSAISSQGTTVAGGAALGSTVGLGVALYRKGKNVLISPGDEIRVKINTSAKLPVYNKTALLQHELTQEGLEVKINDINYEKDPYGEVSSIILTLNISNETNITFSIYDLALINDFNTLFYPAVFGDENSVCKVIKSGDNLTVKIPFSVDNVKHKFWLVFIDRKNNKTVAKISLNNAYRKISNRSKRHNERFFKKKTNFYQENSPFD